jgi:hypothetical protein
MNERTGNYNTHDWRDAGRWLSVAVVGVATLALAGCDNSQKTIDPNTCHKVFDAYHAGNNLSDVSRKVLGGHPSEDKVLEMNALLAATRARPDAIDHVILKDASTFLSDAHIHFIVPANSKVGTFQNCP